MKISRWDIRIRSGSFPWDGEVRLTEMKERQNQIKKDGMPQEAVSFFVLWKYIERPWQ